MHIWVVGQKLAVFQRAGLADHALHGHVSKADQAAHAAGHGALIDAHLQRAWIHALNGSRLQAEQKGEQRNYDASLDAESRPVQSAR